MDDSIISNASAIVTGALTTAATFGFGVDTAAAALIAANAPIMQQIIHRSIHFLFNRNPTKIECARLGIAYDEAAKTIERNARAGKTIRTDGLFEDSSYRGYNRADEIVEASLRYAIDDPETIKARAFGRFIGNVPYCTSSGDSLIAICKNIQELSYLELCTICVFYGQPPKNFTKLEHAIRHDKQDAMEEADFYARILHLKSIGILMPAASFISSSAIGYVSLSKVGRTLHQLMEFQAVGTQDVSRERALFQQYASQ